MQEAFTDDLIILALTTATVSSWKVGAVMCLDALKALNCWYLVNYKVYWVMSPNFDLRHTSHSEKQLSTCVLISLFSARVNVDSVSTRSA